MPKVMKKDPHMSDDDCYIVGEDFFIVEEEPPATTPKICSKQGPVKRTKRDCEEGKERGGKDNVRSTAAATVDIKLAKAETDNLKWKTEFLKAEAEKNKLAEELASERQNNKNLKTELAKEKDEFEKKFKEEVTKMSHNFRELTESQLQCSVCSEVIVEATTINCGHTFYEYCLHEWQKNQSNCPLCRTEIEHKVAVRILDEFADKLYLQLASEDGLAARASLKLRREAEKEQDALFRSVDSFEDQSAF